MGGYSTCTFANASLADICCPAGNISTTSTFGDTSCDVADSGALGDCLVQNGGVLLSARYYAVSSARTAKVGSARLFVLVVLSLIATCALAGDDISLAFHERYRPPAAGYLGTHDRRDVYQCKSFEPDQDQGTWDYGAFLPDQRVSSNRDCTQSAQSCSIAKLAQTKETLNMQWQITSAPASVVADIKPDSILKLVGNRYAASVSSTAMDGFYVPVGHLGYLAATAAGVQVPGQYKDCSDGQEYAGSVLLPEIDGAITHLVLYT